MILVDLSQTVIASAFTVSNGENAGDPDFLRHVTLNMLRQNLVKFRPQYGEMIIAADNAPYWRRTVFPYYKAARSAERDNNKLINWPALFSWLDQFKIEIRTYLPFKLVEVRSAEADDIIATIVSEKGAQLGDGDGRNLILSADKDYQQLQIFSNVDQYDPVRKKKIICNDPVGFLIEQIIKGDRIDGIPNILSPDDAIVSDVRQRPVRQSQIAPLIDAVRNGTEDQTLRARIERNRRLIDLTEQIPADLRAQIISEWTTATPPRGQLMRYFTEYKLNNLFQNAWDFVG